MLRVIDPNVRDTMSIYAQELKYYSGRVCSCVSENNGIPDVRCGCVLGYWYEAPETIHGIRTSVSYKFTNTPQGRIYDGGAQFTIPKYHKTVLQNAHKKLSHGDIIVVPNKTRRETDILTKGVRDKILAFDVKEIISVSRQATVYVNGEDYTINDTTIVWEEDGNSPADGESYTVEFICSQQYKVWEAGARDRGTDEEELPRMVVCVLRRYVTQSVNTFDEIDLQQSL